MRYLFLAAAAIHLLAAQPEPPRPPKAAWPVLTPDPPRPPKNAAAFGLGKPAPGGVFALQGRDRAEAEADREYERGLRAIDKKQWDTAVNHFHEIAALGKHRADAALYWKALALGRLGRGQEAVAVLDTLSKTFVQSQWAQEGQKLRAEVTAPALSEDEEEIKLAAMSGLMRSDAERAVPLLEKVLERRSSPQLQERALQLLTQSDSALARQAVAKVAKGGGNPNLQARAVRHLGSRGSAENRQLLAEVYASSSDSALKKSVLRSYHSAGDRDRVFAVAKSDSDPEMRHEAVRILGAMGAHTQLAELYSAQAPVEMRSAILRAMMSAGGSSKLIELAKTEKDPALRQQAIQYLGGMHSPAATEALTSIYHSTAEAEIRRRILRSFAGQNNARQLIEVAKAEKDPELRRQAIQHLSGMRSPEAMAYLMELLK